MQNMIKKSTIYATGVPTCEERWTEVTIEEILSKHVPKPLKDSKSAAGVTWHTASFALLAGRVHSKIMIQSII